MSHTHTLGGKAKQREKTGRRELGNEGSGNGGGDAGWEGIWNEGCAIGGDVVVGKEGRRMAGVGRAEQGEGRAHMVPHIVRLLVFVLLASECLLMLLDACVGV
jgi:hypothetical protein